MDDEQAARVDSEVKSTRLSVLRWGSVVVLVGGAVAVLLWVLLRKPDVTLTFTQADIQERVASKFPFEKDLLVLSFSATDPVVTLAEGSDRIGLTLNMAAKLGSSQLAQGKLEGDWKVRYEPMDGAFYFDDVNVKRFEVDGLPKSSVDAVADLIKPSLREYLRRTPVYRLKPEDSRQEFARNTLKSVEVKRGVLTVVLGGK